jgi:beta-galactosidase
MSAIQSPDFTPPYLGAAYYPEAWPADEMDIDITRMKESGMSIMRIGEFAWSTMEPEEGRYEFDWLHTAVERLSAEGIATVLGTPTCTPPAWLTQKYPEILPIMDDGRQMRHGERAHRCPNSPIYREYCERIVRQMGERFGHDTNVIGWQIDNEVHTVGNRGCCCPVCQTAFLNTMRQRFGDIEALNEAWGTQLWSQAYNSFDQIPVPDAAQRHHPSLVNAWWRFQSDSYIDFIEHQSGILHELVTQPVGTDMMPVQVMDWQRTHRTLDIVQFNHYNTMDNLWETTLWMSFARSLIDRPWWCTETSTCWNGGTSANGYREPGFSRANSWLPIALGAEANLYWLWRAHWSGQELMHGSVIDSSARPLHVFDEVRETSDGYKAAADFINTTRPVRTGLALHLSGDAWHLYHQQSMVAGFAYKERITRDFYGPMIRAQYRPDVIDPAADLTMHRIVYSPYLPSFEEDEIGERALEWVQNGGTWVVGPLSDIRTIEATKYRHAPFGHLEEWAGIRCKHQIPANPRDFAYRWADGTESMGSIWYDGFESTGADVLATYSEGPLAGLAAVTSHSVGKGKIVVLGTTPCESDLVKLIANLCPEVDVRPVADASPNLLVVPRLGDEVEGLIAVEMGNAPARLHVPERYTDLLTGASVSGEIEIGPYGVLALRRDG